MTKYNVGDIVSDGGVNMPTRHVLILEKISENLKGYHITYTGLVLETGEILEDMVAKAWDQARSVQLVA
jgi:hypothetical protein